MNTTIEVFPSKDVSITLQISTKYLLCSFTQILLKGAEIFYLALYMVDHFLSSNKYCHFFCIIKLYFISNVFYFNGIQLICFCFACCCLRTSLQLQMLTNIFPLDIEAFSALFLPKRLVIRPLRPVNPCSCNHLVLTCFDMQVDFGSDGLR